MIKIGFNYCCHFLCKMTATTKCSQCNRFDCIEISHWNWELSMKSTLSSVREVDHGHDDSLWRHHWWQRWHHNSWFAVHQSGIILCRLCVAVPVISMTFIVISGEEHGRPTVDDPLIMVDTVRIKEISICLDLLSYIMLSDNICYI